MSILSLATVMSSAPAFVPDYELPKKIFLEKIAPLHRPPGGEESMRQMIRDLVDEARKNPAWANRRIEVLEDAYGNMVVRVPGTGRFAGTKGVVALQAHLDMVCKGPGLERGVDVVEIDGRLYSRDCLTTLGADNGFGVAMMLPFVIDPRLEHPPLELVFTLSEEETMKGVRNFQLPLEAHCMINLDSEEEGAVAHACIGGRRTVAEGLLGVTRVPDDFTVLDFAITGLPSGHSGMQIHEDRPNAAVFGGRILDRLLRDHVDATIASVNVAEQKTLNSIPDSLRASLVLPRRAVARLTAQAQKLFAEARANTPGSQDARLSLGESTRTFGRMLTRTSTLGLTRLLAKIPNGVVIRDPAYVFGVRTSSNLGWVEQVDDVLRLGWMVRTWIDAEGAKTALDIGKFLEEFWPSSASLKTEMTGASPRWLGDPDSYLFAAALRVDPTLRKISVPGGLEVAFFSRLFPKLVLMALGPDIRDPHSTKESADPASLARVYEFLTKLLVEVGSCEGNLSSRPGA